MNLTLIAAMSENRVIGKDNDLIWHLPDDLKRFKTLTKGHHVIMGRKTYESLNAPLPHRTNIIVSRKKDFKAPGCMVVDTLVEAIQKAEGDTQPFIVGGGEIYRQAMEYAQTIELTLIHDRFEGDTFFPEINEEEWELVKREEHPEDEKHKYAFDFLTFKTK